ncbi:MAG: peptidoglycan DD-metalloendopeptidase family protein [Oscillospiraceae bacterium]|jgi:murein DD-endopeptidase MepM/ murein hydrolase activator NlpD|nr:peptidoglycan DD-metalloendopeptidase family protein [Oscillospiraceae bacterium]
MHNNKDDDRGFEFDFEEKRATFGERAAAFIGGKGFYIVLFLCVAVIGVSAWTLNLTMQSVETGLSGGLHDLLVTPPPEGNVSNGVPGGPSQGAAAPIASPAQTPEPFPRAEAIATPKAAPTPKPTEKPVAAPDVQPAREVISETDVTGEIPSLFVWPVDSAAHEISRPFSDPAKGILPIINGTRQAHKGIDIPASPSAQAKAIADGVVSVIEPDAQYGTRLVIEHGGGLQSVYCYLVSNPIVGVGEEVRAAQPLGGLIKPSAGHKEYPDMEHLHLETILNGVQVNPTTYIGN